MKKRFDWARYGENPKQTAWIRLGWARDEGCRSRTSTSTACAKLIEHETGAPVAVTIDYKEPISGASKTEGEITAAKCPYPVANLRNALIAETIAMLENSAWCARGAGARLFGWHQRRDPRLLQRNDPFGVNHWVGGAVGVVRDEKGGVPKWDELLKCKCDIDATLQELNDNRLVWNEARFCFVQERDKNLGGNSLYRPEERIATEKRHLKRKWKSQIRLETYKSQDRTAMDVPRRQSVKL